MALNDIPLKCEVVIPDPGQALHDVISRWSDNYVDLPAVVVRPNCEDDIIDAINYAREKHLTLVTANGGHAAFVPITAGTLYLDMKNFNQVTLDKSSATVRIAGGASTGDVIKTLAPEGYYTLWANSDAVGYVGCVLGGGSATMNGLHGFMVDAVESMQLITTNGIKLEVSSSSQGKEKALFNALCGAGFGLVVVTSIVMKAFPIAGLGLTDNMIWTRRVTLPATGLNIAATVFASMHQLPAALTVNMVCLRAPPGAPVPRAPMIALTASYFGPSHEARNAALALFDAALLSKAITAETILVPFADANLAFKPLSAHGGYKGFSSAFLDTIDAETIQTAFNQWLQFTEQYKDASPTALIFGKWDTKEIVRHGETEVGHSKFFEHRYQSISAFVLRWCTIENTRQAVDQFGDEVLKTVRRNSEGPPRSFANNLRPGMNLEELYSKEKLEELKCLKSTWDPHRILWCPY
jgi:hypothetical protein